MDKKDPGPFVEPPGPKKNPEAVRIWEEHKPRSQATSGTSAQVDSMYWLYFSLLM